MEPLRAGPLLIPAEELTERFTHSSGPGGQSVNTSDTRVELRWAVDSSEAVSDAQRERLRAALAARMSDGVVIVVSAEFRSQWRNRTAARARLAALVAQALRPGPPPRRPTRPSRAARQARLNAKRRRSEIKRGRGRPEDFS
jgi:ribosome-associated protein